MPDYTNNYNLIIPQVGDNVIADIVEIGTSNETVDTQLYSIQTQVNNNYETLDVKIDDNYETLDVKIDTQDNAINHRIDQLVLHAAPLPEVAAQQVYDACYSATWDITFDVLTNRFEYDEQKILDTQAQISEFIENYAMIVRLGGIG